MKRPLAKLIPARELPMDEEDLKKLAWKAWLVLQKRLASEGTTWTMQPQDVEFIDYRGQVVARFYNSYAQLAYLVYDVARQKFKQSPELLLAICTEEPV